MTAPYAAIIAAYRRPQQLRAAAASLQRQIPPPAELVVWHNSPSKIPLAGAVNIVAAKNYGPRARHAAGLLTSSRWLVFLDDDTELLAPDLCARLLAPLRDGPERIASLAGRNLGPDGTYSAGVEVREGPCHVAKGWCHAVHQAVLAEAFAWPVSVAAKAEDDITLSAAVWLKHREPHVAVRTRSGEVLHPPPDGLGFEDRPDHYARRDAAVSEWRTRGWNPDRKEQRP